MTTLTHIAALDAGTWISPSVWNSLLEEPQPERPLYWYTSIDSVATEWEELQGLAHLAQLVNDLPGTNDFMVVQDDDPETRYAQTMRLEDGKYTVELGMLLPNGALNLRVGKGAEAVNAPNSPDLVAQGVQELSPAQTIEILISWAAGNGLPPGYAGAIYSYM